MSWPPRVPTWLLAVLVVGCLGAAGWLFWSDATSDHGDRAGSTSHEERELAEGVLEVPDDEGADDGRRGDAGRDRLPDGTGGTKDSTDDADPDSTNDPDADADDEPLPAVFENLDGRRIAIFEASAEHEVGADELVRIGGLRVPCAAEFDAPRLALEHDQVAAVVAVLRRAGALPQVIDDRDLGNGAAGCVDSRVRALEGADLAVVLRAASGRGRVLAGRAVATTDAPSRRASAALAAELAAQLDIKTPRTSDAAARTLLARVAAIDLDGGAAIALVELPLGSTDAGSTIDAIAMSITRALAVTSSRASTPASSSADA